MSEAEGLSCDVLACIYKHATGRDVLRCAQVCRRWNAASKRPDVWLERAKSKFCCSECLSAYMGPFVSRLTSGELAVLLEGLSALPCPPSCRPDPYPQLVLPSTALRGHNVPQVCSFDDMHLRLELLRGIYAYGFEKPSVIQGAVMMPFSMGRSVWARTQAGTGKTATYCVGLLQQLNLAVHAPQFLVLVPTRELAQGVCKVMRDLGTYLPGVTVHTLMGGVAWQNDVAALKEGKQILVCTPGRCMDAIARGALAVDALRHVVLDEADEMMGRGFAEQVTDIVGRLPAACKVSVFTSTWPADLRAFAEKMQDGALLEFDLLHRQVTLGTRHYYVAVDREEWKLETLLDLLDAFPGVQCLIFCNTLRKATWLAEQLVTKAVPCAFLSGDEEEAQQALRGFLGGALRYLICTDLHSRRWRADLCGAVPCHLHYDIPRQAEQFLQRSALSCEHAPVMTISLAVEGEVRGSLAAMEAFYGIRFQECPADIGSQMNHATK